MINFKFKRGLKGENTVIFNAQAFSYTQAPPNTLKAVRAA